VYHLDRRPLPQLVLVTTGALFPQPAAPNLTDAATSPPPVALAMTGEHAQPAGRAYVAGARVVGMGGTLRPRPAGAEMGAMGPGVDAAARAGSVGASVRRHPGYCP
jgi:hypothetical protein